MTVLIEDDAVIGDLQTAALVGHDGSVKWLGLPRFDLPACFLSVARRASRRSLAARPG